MDIVEQRQVYRVPYRKMAGLEVAIVLERADGERFDAEILDLSIKGVGIRFEGERLPDLQPPDEATIEITLSGYQEPLRIPAILRSAFEEPGWCRYGLEFRGGKFPAHGLASRVYSWFNRRSTPRAVATESMEASFERVGGGPIKGRMVDICSSGATVEVARSEGRLLGVGDTTTITFALTEGSVPVSLGAKIQHRESSGSEMKLVVEFQGPYDPDAKDRVDRFVVERLLSQA